MDNVNVRKQDQILMSLVHYFVTKENYSPILVHGVKDEIWLENADGPYRVIRINNNKIINEEQFKFDQFKINDILRQIKKKTFSFRINALNINLNTEDKVEISTFKNIDNIKIKDLSDINKNKSMLEIFPKIKDGLIMDDNGLELIINVTKDINKKTETDNKRFEKIFGKKKIVFTYIIMAICVVVFLLQFVSENMNNYLINNFANNQQLLRIGQLYRLVTYSFLHGSIIHLFCNMYSLYVIGPQIEAKFGKNRFLLIYFGSCILGGLLSASFSNHVSIGASGAIFGLLGSLIYFCYKYRLYMKEYLKTKVIPVVILNIALGFMTSGIDNACHIGGLIGGYLLSMVCGITGEKNKDMINGIIMSCLFILFLCYLVFFR